MKIIKSDTITAAVAELCIRANKHLPEDIVDAITKFSGNEKYPVAQAVLSDMKDNIEVAAKMNLPVCQDTGMACVFAEIGQDVHIEGDFEEAIHEGVRIGYRDGYLRKSIVGDPIRRGNTNDNTPASITVRLVKGDELRLTVMPKGFGSENMSKLAMLKPADGLEGVKEFIMNAVVAAGSNACPPMVIGVGIGGSFDKAAYLAKHALLRPVNERNADPYYAALEEELLEKVNALGIGPQGFGGGTTALGLNIETMPTHVAGLPVAVNISCHVTRRASKIL